MKIRSSALTLLLGSAAVVTLGLLLAILGIGLRFYLNLGTSIDYKQLFLCMLAVVILSFLLGGVRYDLAGSLTLGIAALHDQLLTLALVSIVSIVLPQSPSMPAMVVSGAAFTYCLSVPVLRQARLIARTTPIRELSREGAAVQAVLETRNLRRVIAYSSVLLIIALAVSGNTVLLGYIVPLAAGLGTSLLSSTLITPYIWAAGVSRPKAHK